MKFYSTNNKSLKVSFRDAVLKGLGDDNGLFMPEEIPLLDRGFIDSIRLLTPEEISFEIANAFLRNDIPTERLQQIVKEAINFRIPLVNVHDNIYSLELFHGPTLAFKDVGARFMARVLSFLLEKESQDVTVLVATSGDTGSAVASGFLGVKGIKVVILYPSGKVSEIQEKQLTTLGQNITAIEVKGTFDDCQALVKKAFLDKELTNSITLTSANSINIARLLPQSFYYFIAYAQLPQNDLPVVISVPSGNFGNLTAGLIAKRMGLPIDKFIAATNVNDVIPKYLSNGTFSPRPSVQTISNAMDVGNPSNFARMLDLYSHDLEKMRQDISGCSFRDDETREIMKKVYQDYGYLLDTHGAVGYAALSKYLGDNKANGIFLETAHPAKFLDVVEEVIESKIQIPERLKSYLSESKESILIGNSYDSLKSVLLVP